MPAERGEAGAVDLGGPPGDDGPAADAAADLALPPEVPPDAGLPDRLPARLTIDRDAATFTGLVGCEPQEPTTFRITNAGGSATGALTVVLAGPFAADPDGCALPSLAPGATCEVRVRFKPESAGLKTGMLTASAAPGGEVRASFQGSALISDALAVSPGTADFSRLRVGLISQPRSFQVTNTGGKPLTFTGKVQVNSTEFQISSDNCSNTVLMPSSACEVEVVFRPNSLGAKSAILTATAVGCGGGVAHAVLQGRGGDHGGLEGLDSSGSG